MADPSAVVTLFDSTTSKLQQLQQAFAEIGNHKALSLNLKWIELEAHFHGLEMSLKKKLNELEEQEQQYNIKASEARQILEKQETLVIAKEQSSLEQLQIKRDAAVSDIRKAIQDHKTSPPTLSNNTSIAHTDMVVEENLVTPVVNVGKVEPENVKNDVEGQHHGSPVFKLCEAMDAKGLHKFVSDNRKDLPTIREDIPAALRRAPDCFHLVLDSLKDFYGVDLSVADGKKDSCLLGLRRTCLMLLESLRLVLTDVGSGPSSFEITSDVKAKAKAIADEWKPKLNDLDTGNSNGNSLEAHTFLQLLATFNIASDFDQDEICNLIPCVSRRRQIADLCQSLGLSQRMPGLVETLVHGGRQIEAVNLTCSFGLTEQFPPVPLLKAHLKEVKKVSSKPGNVSNGGQNETNESELSALKAIIKCIEEHKLENQYPTDPLQKRVLQLEKAKADKKRAAEVAKPHSKRPRANGINYGLNGCSYGPRVANVQEKNFYRTPERYPHPYERQYPYPAEVHASPIMGSPSYSVTSSHGGYYTNGYQYHHPAAYIH